MFFCLDLNDIIFLPQQKKSLLLLAMFDHNVLTKQLINIIYQCWQTRKYIGWLIWLHYYNDEPYLISGEDSSLIITSSFTPSI